MLNFWLESVFTPVIVQPPPQALSVLHLVMKSSKRAGFWLMPMRVDVSKRGGVISTITCLKRHGNAEQNIENLSVCHILNSYSLFIWFLMDIASKLPNVGFIKTSVTLTTSYRPWVPSSDIRIHKLISVKQIKYYRDVYWGKHQLWVVVYYM